MLRRPHLFLLGTVLLCAMGCTTLPTRELSQYRAAFSAAQAASEAVLIDYADAIQTTAQPPAPRPATVSFTVELEYGEKGAFNHVEVRRQALRTIDKFNSVLASLAEGKGVEALQGNASGFVQSAQKFAIALGGSEVPGLSALTGALNTLIGAFESARARKEFEAAVRKGAPVIHAMLDELVQDRQNHMNLRVAIMAPRQVDLVSDLTEATASLLSLAREHGQGGASPGKALEDALNKALEPAAEALAFRLPLAIVYQNGKPPFTTEQSLLARQIVERIAAESAEYAANRRSQQRLRSALNQYGLLLRQTQTALNALVGNLDNPQSFEEASETLFDIAFRLKSDWDAYKTAQTPVLAKI